MLKIKEGYNIELNKNLFVQIDQDTAKKIKGWYETALLQQFIYENYNVGENTAWQIAQEAYCEVSDYYLSNNYCVEETAAIFKAAEELHIELKERGK